MKTSPRGVTPGRLLFAMAALTLGVSSCRTRHQQRPTPGASANASASASTGSAAPPVSESAPWPSTPSTAEPEDPHDGCSATMVENIKRVNVRGWTALWTRLASGAPADDSEPDARPPPDAAAIRDRLGVGACEPGCVVIWPLTFPAKAAYVAVPRADKTLAVYGPVLENTYGGQCAGHVAGRVALDRPLHANVTVEESSSVQVCRTDSGELVPWREGLDECMSACAERRWREIDFFLGENGGSAAIVRDGYRGVDDARDHIPAIQRRGGEILVRGVNGCTRAVDLGLTPRRSF